MKYENLVNDVLFEDIPHRYKLQVDESFKDRYVPLQLNGTIGNNTKRGSFKGDIVISNNNVV